MFSILQYFAVDRFNDFKCVSLRTVWIQNYFYRGEGGCRQGDLVSPCISLFCVEIIMKGIVYARVNQRLNNDIKGIICR